MAGSAGKKTSSSNRRNTGTRSGSTKKKTTKAQTGQDSVLFHEIGLIILFVAMVILFCCNFGIIGPVGDAISGFLFGVLGLTAYAAPVLLFLAAAFWFANEGNPNAVRKLSAGIVLFVMLGVMADLITGSTEASGGYSLSAIYEACRDFKAGGGIIAGSIRYFLQHYLETIGTVLVVLLCSVVSLILLTEKSLLESVRRGGSRMRELSREDAERRREYVRARREEQEASRSRREEDRRLREEERRQREEERRLRAEEKENERILRMEKKVSGVMLDTSLARRDDARRRDDIHEITLDEEFQEALPEEYPELEE
ncbi:MAG: DNA translocase FtsK 4TM domain-containing protein [Acetatifactor sp.]|nr:DNA translocase FtsK 4TM domain-containing protein [Acetatifactor sp.]